MAPALVFFARKIHVEYLSIQNHIQRERQRERAMLYNEQAKTMFRVLRYRPTDLTAELKDIGQSHIPHSLPLAQSLVCRETVRRELSGS